MEDVCWDQNLIPTMCAIFSVSNSIDRIIGTLHYFSFHCYAIYVLAVDHIVACLPIRVTSVFRTGHIPPGGGPCNLRYFSSFLLRNTYNRITILLCGSRTVIGHLWLSATFSCQFFLNIYYIVQLNATPSSD